MSNWCNNRLVITGQSVFVDELQQWVNGHVVPDYRHAVQQSCRLFLAGGAGILKPATTKTGVYVPYPALLTQPGIASPQNLAFEHWFGMLKADVPLPKLQRVVVSRRDGPGGPGGETGRPGRDAADVRCAEDDGTI